MRHSPPTAPSLAIASPPVEVAQGLTRAERHAIAGLALATVCWASGFVIGKALVGALPPLVVATWRYAAATLMLLPIVAFGLDRAPSRAAAGVTRTGADSHPAPISRATGLALLAVMTATGGVLYPWTFLMALQETSATNTSLLIALNPALTVLAAPLVGETLTRYKVGCLGIALAGAALVITRGDPLATLAGGLNHGDLLAVVAAALWATFNLASRPVLGRFAPATTNLVVYGIGGIVLLALAWADRPLGHLAVMPAWAIAGIVAMALFSSVLAGQLFLVGMRTLGVGRTVIFIYLVPVLTAGLSSLFLGDRLLASQAFGGAAVLFGVSRMNRGA